MLYTYKHINRDKKANFEIVKIKISKRDWETLKEVDREEYNADQREKRRKRSFVKDFRHNNNNYPIDESDPIHAEVVKNEQNARLYQAIEQLLPEQRQLIKLIFFDEIPSIEIARKENVDKSAISHRKDRALKTLKKLLTNDRQLLLLK